jgi:hypothetical protein
MWDRCWAWLIVLSATSVLWTGATPAAVARPASDAGGNLAWVRTTDDGSSIVAATSDGGAAPVDRDGARDHRHPSWAPDGQHLAFEAGRATQFQLALADAVVTIVDVRRGDAPPTRGPAGSFPSWSPDGRTIAFRTPNGDLAALDVATGRSRLLDHGSGYACIEWSPDSKYVATIGTSDRPGVGPGGLFDPQDVRIVDIDGRHVATYATDIAPLCPVFSPDSTEIALRTDDEHDQRLHTARFLTSDAPVPVAGPSCAQDVYFAWGAHGLATTRRFYDDHRCSQLGGPCGGLNDPCIGGLWLLPTSSDQPSLLRAMENDATNLSWSPDDRMLAYDVPTSVSGCSQCSQQSRVHLLSLGGDDVVVHEGGTGTIEAAYPSEETHSVRLWTEIEPPHGGRPEQPTAVSTGAAPGPSTPRSSRPPSVPRRDGSPDPSPGQRGDSTLATIIAIVLLVSMAVALAHRRLSRTRDGQP